MTETQKRIKAYQDALPGLRERVAAVALLLVMSMAMMTSASFAWLTISRRPELSGVATNIAANGSLEIALATGDGKTAPGESKVGDSSATEGQSIFNANKTWGNLINLSDPAYGLDHLALRPAQLNTAALLTRPLYGAVYSSDGRITNLTNNYGYTAWIPAEGNKPAHFGVSDEVGVRAISSVKRQQTGFAGDYSDAYSDADIANNTASNTYTAITKNQTWMDVLAKLLGIHMTASLNSEDKYKNATINEEDMAALIAMYQEFLLAHDQEAEAMAKMLNLQLFAAHGGNTAAYTPFSKADILKISTSDSRINQTSGDFSFDENTSMGSKTIKLTNLKAFLKDYKQLTEDLAKMAEIDAGKDYRWTASGLYKIVERLMDVNKCLIRKGTEEFRTVQALMDDFGSNPLSALGYMGANCDIIITNGVLYNLEQRVGSTISIQGMKVTAKMYVNTMNLGEQTANITANVTTSATKPSDFYKDQTHTDTLNTGADSSSGEAVAEDTYALAVDFWVRTNAANSYLTLEGNVLLSDPYDVPIMTEDVNGNQVQLYTLTRVVTDEESGQSVTTTMEVYKKESGNTVTWYRADNHRELTEDELNGTEPTPRVEQRRDVIGYEGENRVWDKDSNMFLTADSTTQGVGSCYVYYADTPEDQARSLELLKSLKVAFVDGNGALLATASMDTENFYGDSGRFVVPLKVNDDGIRIIETGSSGEEITTYAITSLVQNQPTRITAIVYLDGRDLGNENVLSAADIQGQLNIQFGNNLTLEPIANEKLEGETRTVTASVDTTAFDYDTHVGDMTTNVTVRVSGAEPSNVKAFFMRKINATQGSRESEMTFTKNAEGNWVASYTFTAPGEYILRSVYLDGVEYVLHDVPAVKINGFTIASLVCDETTGRHKDVMTELSSTSLTLRLKFASDDVSKMPNKVQGRFIRSEDGSAVNVTFTMDSTHEWKGTATFLKSGNYTLQYLLLDGEHTELEESKRITANIKLGMKVAVYTTDITEFKYAPDEMVEKGTDSLQMQVKILDNSGKELVGLTNVKLKYQLEKSASTMDADLTWNAAERYYTGDLQALTAGPGVWVFQSVIVTTESGTNTITYATTSPRFEMQAPEPPSFVRADRTGTQYRPNGDGFITVELKYSGTATVAAVFRDGNGNRYPVMGTAGSTDQATNVTTWNFAVPRNASGAYRDKQDGHWTLETVYLWNYYMANGTYVEWEKEKVGDEMVVKGSLELNADGSLKPNEFRDDDNVMAIDIKSVNNGDYTVKVIQTVTVDFTSGQQNADFGKTGDTVTGKFMDSYTISDLTVKITDFEGEAIGGDLVYTITYKNNTSTAYGGYTNSDLEKSSITYVVTLTPDATGTVFTQSEPITLRYAGTYTTTLAFRLNGNEASLSNKGVQVIGSIPQFTVSSVKPTLSINSISPNGQHTTVGADESNKTVTSKIEGNKVTIYANSKVEGSGCNKKGVLTEEPKVTLKLTDIGNAERAILTFMESSGGTVRMYYGSNSKNGTQTDSYIWEKGGSETVMRFIGYNDAGSCDDSEPAGTLNSMTYIVMEYKNGTTTETFTVSVSQITIVNVQP